MSRAGVIATAVTATGNREVLGIDVCDSEDGAFWTALLNGLRARGFAGVQLVISDHHLERAQAIGGGFIGAAWQRSSVHHPPWRGDPVSSIAGWREGPAGHPRRRERALAA